MFLDSILLIITIIFSFFLFFINNIYILLIILFGLLIIAFSFKVSIPIYKSFIILLLINYIVNMFFSNYIDAFMVIIRLFIMFILVNIVIKKIGVLNIGKIIGNIFHSDNLSLVISISLSFIPLMIKEISSIKMSLKSKNFNLNLKNILTRPSVFVMAFFTNLFKSVDDLEKVLLSKGYDD